VDVASWAVLAGVFALVVALCAAIGISIAAFAQGRELSLWPPRIGERPPDYAVRRNGPMTQLSVPTMAEPTKLGMSGASGVVRAYRQPDISLPNRSQLFDREFGVDQCVEFYNLIAPHYDERNSGELITTHLETVRRIKMVRADRADLRVLDLGGGTGMYIAMSFFDEQNVSWDYVDHSSRMLDQFQRNFLNTALFLNTKVYLENITTLLPRLPSESYDVVLLSLVLSSMPDTPDFEYLTRIVAPGGALIISDIDPSYTLTHPHYAVQVNGSRYALRSRPVKPLDLVASARAHGFHADDLVSIVDNKTDYSFLGVFRAASS
jgi:ubiquinone/menaquinone biosynthesis C-methylase UbiE